MKKLCYSYDEARDFIKENDVQMRYALKDVKIDSMYDRFNIEDYCRIVPIYIFMEFVDAGTNLKRWHYQSHQVGLQIIATGEVFTLFETGSKRYLLVPTNPIESNRSKNFRFEQKMPNFIGVPSKKKIEAWVEYHHLSQTAKRNYLNGNLCRNNTFAKRFKEKYPDARYWEDEDGWVSRFRIIIDALDYRFIATEDGKFIREVSIYRANLPTNEELLK